MDSGRKDMSTSKAAQHFTTPPMQLVLTSLTEASEKVTPDSSKSTLDKAKEGVTDAGDKVAR